MKIRLIDGVEVRRGSGNVFADLDLVDAEKLKIKTGLVVEIRNAMRNRGLTQQEAAKLMGISQPKVTDMMRGDFTNLSERKLMDCLTRFGYDIEINPTRKEQGWAFDVGVSRWGGVAGAGRPFNPTAARPRASAGLQAV